MYSYQAYGLEIISEFCLPELPLNLRNRRSEESGFGASCETLFQPLKVAAATVVPPPLENAYIPRQGLEAWFGGTAEEAYLQWPGIATFKALGGHTLLVNQHDSAMAAARLNLYILSEALGMILFQRGLFLLHASAVCINEKVVVFLGMPGAGKSTTAAAFAKKGYPVLSDDMVAILLGDDGQPFVVPGFPQIKIWAASVEGLGLADAGLPALFEGSQKQVIRQFDGFPTSPMPLSYLYLLEPVVAVVDSLSAFESVGRVEAAIALTKFFPCPAKLLQGKALVTHFSQCQQILAEVPMSRLYRRQDFSGLEALIEQVCERLA